MLTPLLENEEYGLKFATMLVRAGADTGRKDASGKTALTLACQEGKVNIATFLLQESEDILEVNFPDQNGNTPLAHAAINGHLDLVKHLVHAMRRYHMTIDTRNHLGYTPLHLACKRGHYATAYVLLTEGRASPSLRDNEYFLNARDWVHTTSDFLPCVAVDKRSKPRTLKEGSGADTIGRGAAEHPPVSGPSGENFRALLLREIGERSGGGPAAGRSGPPGPGEAGRAAAASRPATTAAAAVEAPAAATPSLLAHNKTGAYPTLHALLELYAVQPQHQQTIDA